MAISIFEFPLLLPIVIKLLSTILGRAITTYKKQRIYTKNQAKKIKSNNFARSNIEKFKIAILILTKNLQFESTPKLFRILIAPILFSLTVNDLT